MTSHPSKGWEEALWLFHPYSAISIKVLEFCSYSLNSEFGSIFPVLHTLVLIVFRNSILVNEAVHNNRKLLKWAFVV